MKQSFVMRIVNYVVMEQKEFFQRDYHMINNKQLLDNQIYILLFVENIIKVESLKLYLF